MKCLSTATENASNAPARRQSGVTLTVTDGRQRRLEQSHVFKRSETITVHGY